jgi:hypothetical protein
MAQAPVTRTTNLEQTRKEPLGFDGGWRNIAITLIIIAALSRDPCAHARSADGVRDRACVLIHRPPAMSLDAGGWAEELASPRR